uniref:Uncharacterized protein n=1 Tax=Anguilla anguilla TaxID=7936 RepID=A0A0E9W0X0_ANGAN
MPTQAYNELPSWMKYNPIMVCFTNVMITLRVYSALWCLLSS